MHNLPFLIQLRKIYLFIKFLLGLPTKAKMRYLSKIVIEECSNEVSSDKSTTI